MQGIAIISRFQDANSSKSQMMNESEYFYTGLVRYFTNNGNKEDQEHIPSMLLNLPINSLKDFKACCYIALSRCNRLIFTDKLSIEEKQFLKNNLISYHLLSEEKSEDIYKELSKKYGSDLKLSEGKEYLSTEIIDFKNNESSIIDISVINKYIKGINAIGVIGGAGPLAAAKYYENLFQKHVPFIAIEYTRAPYKQNCIGNAVDEGQEGDFVCHYKHAIDILENLVRKITMPCNTAHIKLSIFNEYIKNKEYDLEFIDIRDSVISKILNQNERNEKNEIRYHAIKEVAVFGTPATIQNKIYDGNINSIKLVICDVTIEQQEIIRDIIFKIKKNNQDQELKQIKSDFLKFVDEFRLDNPDCYILLVCTELSVLFTEEECVKHRFISSTHCLANEAKKNTRETLYVTENRATEEELLDNIPPTIVQKTGVRRKSLTPMNDRGLADLKSFRRNSVVPIENIVRKKSFIDRCCPTINENSIDKSSNMGIS